MSDLNLATGSNAPGNTNPKPVEINILKSSGVEDLRATFTEIQETFNIQTPDFYNKLGDLMLSSQSFSVSSFKSRFYNLLDEYSQGVVTDGEIAAEFGQVTNPKTGKTFVEYKSSTSGSLMPETDASSSFETPQERKTTEKKNINITPVDPKDVTKPSNILIENAVENLFNLANRTGTINNIDIFLYNTIPLLAGGAMASIVSGANPTEKITLPIKQAISTFMAGKYFTPAELAYLAVASFYTLTLKKGISIKDLTTGPGVEFSPNVTMSKPENIIAGNKSTSQTYDLNVFGRDDNRGSPVDRVDLKNDLDKYLDKSNYQRKVDVTDLSPYRTTWGYKSGDGSKDVDIITLEGEERKNKGVWAIGCLYIWPVDREIGKGTTISPSVIPFEFNPIIGEGDVSARYTSMAILSRIGDLQSFTGVNSLSVSVSTSYYALGEKEQDAINPAQPSQLSHLSYFSLERLQKIEQGFRSLVLPYHGEDTQVDKDTGYRYVRPPLVKVIMGDYKDAEDTETPNQPYANLLLYPSAVIGDKFKNIGDNKFRKYKTFICTSVKIDKAAETYPYYITNGTVKDMMGFGVDLSLIEVSPSYAQSLPSFLKTYNAANLQKTTGGV